MGVANGSAETVVDGQHRAIGKRGRSGNSGGMRVKQDLAGAGVEPARRGMFHFISHGREAEREKKAELSKAAAGGVHEWIGELDGEREVHCGG